MCRKNTCNRKLFTSSLFLQYTHTYIFCHLVLQATAEQIRLAQMIYDKNDADFEDKVNQVSCPFLISCYPTVMCLLPRLHGGLEWATKSRNDCMLCAVDRILFVHVHSVTLMQCNSPCKNESLCIYCLPLFSANQISCSSSQLMEVTGKNQDECMVALHDCNEDVSRAINFLLECTSDMVNNTLC